ncbi:hypothetical protein [Streptomyces turgidiscabies]|uniref:Uncharacterized protein n=1 Tax=Streptomyces turgidiscabies TaxID=85558 RepID=A0ABU0RV99_9ACTN|nr:hypothetical protein [Streptomyces turgidiscabies]MDQ0935087.1 hypothetical protein [Streptomyces turgidiscabies]
MHAAGSDLERRLNRYWETFRQKDDLKTFLGPVAREQFATVIPARSRPTPGSASPRWPAPPRSPARAPVHVVQDGSAHQTQALLLADAEAADWFTATVAGEI